jgi:2-polyprenyl-3-methyl-5-hydroxy-6-metoxy-1,4-benzoquinol methylase
MPSGLITSAVVLSTSGGWKHTNPTTGRVVSMAVRIDPEGNETDALFDLVDVEGRQVLEIGCGDGRLTRRYADRAAHVTAIEPFEDSIARAQKWLSEAPNERVEFRHVAFEDLVAASDADVFDVALLSWSLC